MTEYVESICLGCNKVTKIPVTKHWYMKNGKYIEWKRADYSNVHICVTLKNDDAIGAVQ